MPWWLVVLVVLVVLVALLVLVVLVVLVASIALVASPAVASPVLGPALLGVSCVDGCSLGTLVGIVLSALASEFVIDVSVSVAVLHTGWAVSDVVLPALETGLFVALVALVSVEELVGFVGFVSAAALRKVWVVLAQVLSTI